MLVMINRLKNIFLSLPQSGIAFDDDDEGDGNGDDQVKLYAFQWFLYSVKLVYRLI